MEGDKHVVSNFNRLLVNELIIANRYFLHSKIFKHWGLVRLSDIERQESIDEMKHVDYYVERVLFLEGKLLYNNVKSFSDICCIGKDVKEILCFDLDLENNTIKDLRECIVYADKVRDFISRDMMEKILSEEEQHIHFLETELALITRLGISNYLQSQLR